MSRLVYQNQTFTFRFRALDGTGAPVTGLTDTDFTLEAAEPGVGSFSSIPKTLFTEIGNGFYQVGVADTLSQVLGQLTMIAKSSGNQDYIENIDVVPTPLGIVQESETCLIQGNITDLAGRPVAGNTPVAVRGVDFPITLPNSFVSTSKIETNTAADGSFSVQLLRGQRVQFQIDKIALKVTIEVPNQASARLEDLIPS